MIPACYLLLAGYTVCVVAGLFWCFPKRSPPLTDAEREAIEYAAVVGRVASDLDCEVLLGLLARARCEHD